MWAEWQIFLKNPILGVGPGAGYEARKEIVGFRIASHTEVTRLLAEHGLFGLVIAIIFLIFPLIKILRSPVGFDRIISTAFFSFAILTSFHAAMRTTVTPFLWGLACANFSEFSEKKRLRRSNSEFS
jgi:O-antigen ligase